MLIRCCLLLLFLNCVRTSGFSGNDGLTVAEFNRRFALWPSVHNAAKLMRVRREAEKAGTVGQSEGGTVAVPSVNNSPPVTVKPSAPPETNVLTNEIAHVSVAPAAAVNGEIA